MTKHTTVAAVLAFALVASLTAGVHAWPGQYNTIRFNAAVALPGVVLPAGEYRFEVLRAASADVVRVSSTRDDRAYYMGFTTFVPRPHSLGQRVIVLGEAAAGSPPPIRIWFPSEGGEGREFIY